MDDILHMQYRTERDTQTIKTNLALKKLKIALEHMKDAWRECDMAMQNLNVDVNFYICEAGKEDEKYPFDKSFDEIGVVDWVDGAIRKIDKDLNVRGEILCLKSEIM